MAQRILALAAHPDDETLGCGGTLLKHKAQGDEIFWLIATNSDNFSGLSPEARKERALEIQTVSHLYQFNEIFQLNHQTTALDQVSDAQLVTELSDIIKKVKPSVVYTPFSSDPHTDHQKLFKAAVACTKSFRYPSVQRILMMEILSETDFALESRFTPQSYSNISQHLEKKLQIMKLYKSELGPYPFPRSIEAIKALAMTRGAAANCQYAEAFMLLKEIF